MTAGPRAAANRGAGVKHDPYPCYRDSGVEWLGEVPEHWEVARLKWSTSGTVNGVWGDEPDGENDIACVRVGLRPSRLQGSLRRPHHESRDQIAAQWPRTAAR